MIDRDRVGSLVLVAGVMPLSKLTVSLRWNATHAALRLRPTLSRETYIDEIHHLRCQTECKLYALLLAGLAVT